jgi:hypothetical protein
VQTTGTVKERSIAQGLTSAEQALTRKASMVEALVVKGRLLLLQAASRPSAAQKDSARRAAEALRQAIRADPRQQGKLAPLLLQTEQ